MKKSTHEKIVNDLKKELALEKLAHKGAKLNLKDKQNELEIVYHRIYKYTVKDIKSNRICYTPKSGLRQIIEIEGSWLLTLINENFNEPTSYNFAKYEIPNLLLEFMVDKKIKKLTKEQLLEYMKSKYYMLREE